MLVLYLPEKPFYYFKLMYILIKALLYFTVGIDSIREKEDQTIEELSRVKISNRGRKDD